MGIELLGIAAILLMGFVQKPPDKPVFAKKQTIRFNDFSGGLNNKFSPLLLADNEVSDIQNFNYDEKGTLQKRKGYLSHYATAFGTGPVLGLYNYRKEDGLSQIIVACDGSIFYDTPNFTQEYGSQAEWEASGTTRKLVDTTSVVGSVRHSKGHGLPGFFLPGSRWAILGGATTLKEGVWVTQTIDISTILDKTSGTVTIGTTLPVGTSITIETRVSPDGTNWDGWFALGGGNQITNVGTRNFLQVRARFNSNSRMKGQLNTMSISFDQTPAVSTMGSGLSTAARYDFATQNDVLYIVNGVDTNRKWDGTTFDVQGGSPPVRKFVIVHKNYMFLMGHDSTNRSRVYYSPLATPDGPWNALDFFDVGKGDGDTVTGGFVQNDQLNIYKDHSTWVLQGDSPSNFVLRKATDEAGTVHKHSIVVAKNSTAQWDRNGMYFFDGVRAVVASEKIEQTLAGLNPRQLQKVAAIVFEKKIYIALPEGPAQFFNNVVLIFDTLRTAWTVYRGINASEFVIWRRNNADTLLFGSSEIGQVYDMETGFNDDGSAIDAYVVTKAVDFGAAELLSLVRKCLVTGVDPEGGTSSGKASFFRNLDVESATQDLEFDRTLNVLRALPGKVGIGPVHTLAMKIRNDVLDEGLNIYSIAMEFVRKGVRATG